MRTRAVLVATTLAFVLISTGLIAVFFATPAQAHSSTVTVLDGQVLVRHGAGGFAAIADGDTVAAGDTVRTAQASHGVLTFFDGTTVELEPDTEVTITTLQASASGDKVVEMTQAFGRTWHVVTHLASANSKYEIKTGASTAAVRGTAFEVAMLADGTTSTITTDGDVATTAQGSEVHVLAGQVTAVTQGSPPPQPQPAPEPAATVKITVDLTQNAIVTDANGRGVGVQNGQPVRYIPGSKVEVVGGKLVVTIPNAQLGVLSTNIKPDATPAGAATPDAVTVQTQVSIKDVGVVANSLTARPVENGTAKGAVVVTDTGLLLVPNSDAKNAPDPHIGKAPVAPTGIFQSTPTTAPAITAAPVPTGGPVNLPITPVDVSKALDVTIAAFIPFQTISTATATSTGVVTEAVNSGVITLTSPIENVFTVPTPPAVTSGIVPLATAGPTRGPIFTLPPHIALPPETSGAVVPGRGAFATPIPVAIPQVTSTPPAPPEVIPGAEVKPTPVPAPRIVPGFAPPADVFAPTAPPAPTVAPILRPALDPIVPATPAPVPTPGPTLAPVITFKPAIDPILLATPIPVPTPAPTLAPTITFRPAIDPILLATPSPAPTPAPTLAPTITFRPAIDPILLATPAPTPAPTSAPTLAPIGPRFIPRF